MKIKLKEQKMKKITQNKYTDRLILFTNMMIPYLQSSRTSSFRDKREILNKVLNLEGDDTQKCVEQIYSLNEFILNYWENKNFSNNSQNHFEDSLVFDFLHSIRHDRILPVLYFFKDSNEWGNVVKVCAGFTCLWRGFHPSASTDRIDSKYEQIIKELFKDCKNDIQFLKKKMIMILKKERNDNRRELNKKDWIERFKTIDIYKQKKLSRFLLFVAFHKRKFENEKLEDSKLKLLTMENWVDKDYRSVEHITPRSYKSIDKIGNLILLPQDINSKVGSKIFLKKKRNI